MKPRTSFVLAVLAVIALVGGWFAGPASSGPVAGAVAHGGLAFPGLVGRLQDAAAITIAHKGTTLRLDRKGHAWSVANDGGYPAKPELVHALLVGLTELRLDEPRTAQPSEFSRLGVDDPGKNADGTLVRVLDSAGKPIVSLIVGHQRTGAGADEHQLYVRRPEETQSWLADGQIEPDSEAQNWMDRSVLNIGHGRLASITATKGDAHLVLTRKNDTFALTDPADGPKLDATMLNDVTHALEMLHFVAVKPAAQVPGTPAGSTVYVTQDGLTLTATLNKQGDSLWAHFAASGTGKAAKEATTMNGHLAPWAFKLASYKTKPMLPTLADLKAAPPMPKPAAMPTMPPPAPSAAPSPTP